MEGGKKKNNTWAPADTLLRMIRCQSPVKSHIKACQIRAAKRVNWVSHSPPTVYITWVRSPGARARTHTRTRAHIHPKTPLPPNPSSPPVFRDQTFNQTFLQLTHTISEECEMAPCVLVHPWRERRRRLERGRLRAVSTVCVTNDGDGGGGKKREREDNKIIKKNKQRERQI